MKASQKERLALVGSCLSIVASLAVIALFPWRSIGLLAPSIGRTFVGFWLAVPCVAIALAIGTICRRELARRLLVALAAVSTLYYLWVCVNFALILNANAASLGSQAELVYTSFVGYVICLALTTAVLMLVGFGRVRATRSIDSESL